MIEPRAFLRALFDAAIAAARPSACLPPHLPPPPRGRLVVVGCGKAAAEMARVVEEHYAGFDRLTGVVVTRYGHAVLTRRIRVIEAAHPVPDAAGAAGARAILDAVRGLGPDDLVLCLISGGGSALTTLPGGRVTLDDLRVLNRALLESGAPIGEMNAVRKHLSAFSGGRLAAAAHPATVIALAISDAAGDDPSTIASGPTVPDPTTREDAREMLTRRGIDPAPSITARLADPDCETPKPGDPRLAQASFQIIASGRGSLDAAAAIAKRAGLAVHDLGDAVEGEAREVARDQAALALAIRAGTGPVRPPCVILSGGETTVTVRAKGGRGGRNSEYLLALALALNGTAGIHVIAGDTDGIDGSEANAGALLAPDTLARARAAGLDPAACLARNDAYALFAAVDGLVTTGPTLTNVNDFRAIAIVP
jgi:hydroxypyruvate reductase